MLSFFFITWLIMTNVAPDCNDICFNAKISSASSVLQFNGLQLCKFI